MTRKERALFKAAGFSDHETDVIIWCVWAWDEVPGGPFLPSERRQKAARALIERGVLTEGKPVIWSGGRKSVTVSITQAAWDTVRAKVSAAAEGEKP